MRKSPVVLQQRIMEQLATMRPKVSVKLAQQQERYKHYFDKKARSLPAFKTGQMVYVNRPPLLILAVCRLTSAGYNELMPCTIETFNVLEVRENAPNIDENVWQKHSQLIEQQKLALNTVTDCLKAKMKDVAPRTCIKTDEKYSSPTRL